MFRRARLATSLASLAAALTAGSVASAEPEAPPPPGSAGPSSSAAPSASPSSPSGPGAPPRSQPVASDPPPAGKDCKDDKSESTRDKIVKYDGAFDVAIGLAGSRLDVNMDTRQSSQSLGMFLHLGAFGAKSGGAFSFKLSSVLAQGGAGFEVRSHGEAFAGLGLPVADGGQVFLELGASGSSFKNDELEANVLSAPMAYGGFQQSFDGFGFQLGPRGGIAIRTEWEPGDEAAGRRHQRALKPRVGYGGAVAVASKYIILDGSLLRVAGTEPLYAANGQVCLVAAVLVACGFVDYWRSVATTSGASPLPPVTRDVDATYIGIALGFGTGGAEVASSKPSTPKARD